MYRPKILIIGHCSFVGRGLDKLFVSSGFEVDCFSRGDDKRDGNIVTGKIFGINTNNNLSVSYDIVINFVILKDLCVEDNIRFIESVVDLCRTREVKQLIHFSSIMVYDNNEPLIDEKTNIESHTFKKGYGEIKIEVDRYLMSLVNPGFQISFVRPGYVLADDRPCPFIKQLPLGIIILKGDKKSTQPIVTRADIHNALLNIIQKEIYKPVYLFVPHTGMTKYSYASEKFGGIIFTLPKWIILGFVGLFLKLKLIDKSFFVRIEGMYIESEYDSTETEKLLEIEF